MTITDILNSVQFVVDQKGQPTAAVLDMSAWEAFVSMLEDMEDIQLIREKMETWRSKQGWTRWEDLEKELLADELPSLD